MIFTVERASHGLETKKSPCRGAVKVVRPADKKYIEITYYTIEINSLDEMMKFNKKHGDIVIRDDLFIEGMKRLIIYDDYLE